MKVTDYYTQLGSNAIGVLQASLGNEDLELLSSNHAFIHDLSLWLEVLDARPESSILKNAVKEFQIAILSNNLGFYQQAFMGLRFFFERTLVAIHFSAKEIELNLWKLGERDTYWSELVDKDNGIFSTKFCKAFFPELKDEIRHFEAITTKIYRECSEFVHGNQSVIKIIPGQISYSKELFYEWNIKADAIRRVVLFVLCLRYLKHLGGDDVKKVENTIADEFKSISQIKDLIIN
ncbi:hypothetical protein HGH92_21510 [Chitinophaga varians]|uniref:Uncharacterized protein n=1 Tax=Chitinophaga varians TaxID=2202339 RepID=A0A847RM72_9BACT|nr:hypothetical protein [Chitinophaga varians]NLR66900.1 hypothetical protein [Chitinophaga varians]